MKKTLLFLAAAFMALCASAQQKGDVGIGINLGVAPVIEDDVDMTNFGLGAKINYNATDEVRLELNTNYWFKDKNMSIFDISANFHYLIPVADRFLLYPLVGVGYARPHVPGISTSIMGVGVKTDGQSWDRVLVNVGIGGELALTNDLSLGLEVKYQYIKDLSRIPINLSLTYRF
jgi:outer membrane protein X